MKILVVGGAGMIGGRAALHLKGKGHDVTIAGRTPPAPGTPLGDLPFLRVDYINMAFDREALGQFDALVFAAGNDVRHKPQDIDDSYWHDANSVGVPRFFAAAKEAGIRRAVNVGSFYPQAAPELVATNAYVRSRKESDDGVAALADDNFAAMSVNAPFVVGAVPGLTLPMFAAYTQYAEGKFAPMPEFTPPGGTNFISTQSLAEAIEGALERGEPGASYLVGDENLSFQDYFGAFFEGVGRAKPPVRDEEHPMLPDGALFFGRGNSLFYETDPKVADLLSYRRQDVKPAIAEIVAQYRS
ncbi:NAD-dependent epimerase/dehydratase family protein [Sphingomonas sanxanigenens]|uniref:Nucleoside-diphosphate sugar epimerase n=1 Tax=Sphingomonas sanxanigenens DSM 19645 = NX02 TaxID=1123269 RepID=W0A6I7_9SPHN|nr:NAD-dependent epimerase/dehydratase family protein [Sphingomonas sanxanigenens]AHE52082.1 nucleoside-diphosphate sugar epimerase [Sphingomonas sanxanigenens DSM 19645 = NX02]